MAKPVICATIDFAQISKNAEAIIAATNKPLMAVVKADGYGHGLIPTAQAALRGGATWLGVAFTDEALTLRKSGITAQFSLG